MHSDPASRPRNAPQHGHGHRHSPAPPASRRVRRLLVVLLLPCALAAVAGALLLYPWGKRPTANSDLAHQVPVKGDVIAVVTGGCTPGASSHVGAPTGPPADTANADPQGKQCLLVTVQMTDGVAAGQSVTEPVPIEPSTPRFSVGDHVVLAYNGSNPGSPDSYEIVDFQRGVPLVALALLFALAVLVLGRWQGLAALGALVLSFLVLVFFVLPAILAGHDPVLVAVVGAGLIMFAVLYLTHGLSARTSTAVLGTLVSLALIGALGVAFSAVAKLTGLDEDTANLIAVLGHGVDSRGLLLAGVVIGALGVLDDVTVTQTSAVWELRRANPALGWRQLYAAGLRIGRDHVASAVNTLVMAYAGAALPVLLAYSVSGRGFGDVVSVQAVAQEVMRTLVGSIGLVASVPITTVLAALVASHERIEPADEEPDEEPDEDTADQGDPVPAEPDGAAEPAASVARTAPANPPTARGQRPERAPAGTERRIGAAATSWTRRDTGSWEWPDARERSRARPDVGGPARARPEAGPPTGAPPRPDADPAVSRTRRVGGDTSAWHAGEGTRPGPQDHRVWPPEPPSPGDEAPRHAETPPRQTGPATPPSWDRRTAPGPGEPGDGRPTPGGRPGGTLRGRLAPDEFDAPRWPREPSEEIAAHHWPPEPPEDRPEPGPPRRHRYREP
ncbi:YibE/F family protein [Gandjariella thermophila]|uniref:YibE/F family protein n=1 Tax=Gandjariella thermophila TaxID=1931992 RepID=A0A4D4J0D6_9PSEU|nr:hypothetical protein GTS_04470 [Gandjariella thermophila]